MAHRRTSELEQIMTVSANLPGPQITQFPSGRFGFAGRVPVSLSHTKADGSPLTADQITRIQNFGPGLMLRSKEIKSVSFKTQKQAETALRKWEKSQMPANTSFKRPRRP